MATNTLHDLHFELERSIARRVDSKLIGYQVSLSDGFYNKYTKLWNKTYSFDFVTKHRSFYTKLTKCCVFDIAESKEDFQNFFEKKYSLKFPNLNDCIYQKKKELSDFDKKLWIAMHYNPRKDEGE